MKTIGILIFDDLEELDAVGPYEVFGTASALFPEDFKVFLVGATNAPVTCVNGMRILPHHIFADCPKMNVLLIPGGTGTRQAAKDPAMLDFIKTRAAEADLVASVCSGARLTVATGLAAGKRVTTHWGVIEEIRATGVPKDVLSDVRFVRDGNVVHSAGISAGIDMSLWLVGQLATPAKARAVQREMQYDPAPPYAFEA